MDVSFTFYSIVTIGSASGQSFIYHVAPRPRRLLLRTVLFFLKKNTFIYIYIYIQRIIGRSSTRLSIIVNPVSGLKFLFWIFTIGRYFNGKCKVGRFRNQDLSVVIVQPNISALSYKNGRLELLKIVSIKIVFVFFFCSANDPWSKVYSKFILMA